MEASSPSLLEEIAGLNFHDRLRRIEGDAKRIAAFLHDLDLPPQQPAKLDDAEIAGRKILFGMQADRSLPDLRFPIAGEALMLFLAELGPDAVLIVSHFDRLEILRHFARVEQAKMRVV